VCPGAARRFAAVTTPLPFVSVVVPTWNRAALLGHCLATLVAQDYPRDRFEIVVVDDGSTDGTAEVAESLPTEPPPVLRYVRQPHRGVNAGRNTGIEAARGDPICFVDDESDVPRGWLTAIVDGVRRRADAGCLGGPIRLRFESTPPRICAMESWAREGELDWGPEERVVPHINGGNMAVRRWALGRVGRFHDALSCLGDETEWQRRLQQIGIPIVYLPAAWLEHRRPAEVLKPLNLLRRRFRQGRATVTYTRLIGEPLPGLGYLADIPFYIVHALRYRCFGALLSVAWKLGRITGRLRPERGLPIEPKTPGGGATRG